MDLFDTLTWVEILEKTTFLGTPTLTVLKVAISFSSNIQMNFFSIILLQMNVQ
jgi:hypothetical protein